MRTPRLFICVFGFAAFSSAATKPTFTSPQDPRPIPVAISISPTRFVADGETHAPKVTVKPAEATYEIKGSTHAIAPGDYSFTVSATGKYVGSSTCRWRIDRSTVRSAPAAAAAAKVTADVLHGDRVVYSTVLTFEKPRMEYRSVDGKIIARALLSPVVARTSSGRLLTTSTAAAWRCYGSIAPAGARGMACDLVDGSASASTQAVLNANDGGYLVRLTRSAP